VAFSSSLASPASRRMPLPIFGETWVYGGPYPQKPRGMFGVNLAAEIRLPAEVSLPIGNFLAPNAERMNTALIACAERLARGETLYAGCRFGFGRTGLFLACLAKACGVEDPIAWTRERFDPRAVESAAQRAFVEAFDPEPARRRLEELGAFAAPKPKA
jgi:hypothetical protein